MRASVLPLKTQPLRWLKKEHHHVEHPAPCEGFPA
jgi:hypothetical protein